MVAVQGLVGMRPAPEHVSTVASPPYDVIKPGSPMEELLGERQASLYHVLLGDSPATTLEWMRMNGYLVEDDEPSFYVYEQSWGDESRTGVFVAAEVTPYDARQIIRHEKVFDEKVAGRIELRAATHHSFGPVFVLTRAQLGPVLAEAKSEPPLYDFTTDLGNLGNLHGIHNRVWRVPQASDLGARIEASVAMHPLYIADGHHRYHASLKNDQSHFLCYITEDARIQAYNRVVNGIRTFEEIRDELALTPVDALQTPPKHTFCLATKAGTWLLPAQHTPDDVVGRLDCAILERELYPKLGLTHDMIQDRAHFDYFAETALDEMRAAVELGDYDLAIALHPVSLDELIAVADAGLGDPEIVMPEKSTYFAPKILSGLVIYRHTQRG